MLKQLIVVSTLAVGLSACASSGSTLGDMAQQSLQAGKNAAINTGVNAVTGKLTGANTAGMSSIAKETVNSGKNAAIQKATDSLLAPAQ